MQYICDTNFIVRYLVTDNQEMFAKANEIFDQVKIGKITLIIEQAVFMEVVFVLTSVYLVPKTQIVETLSELMTYKGVISDKELLLRSLDFYRDYNLHIVDCLLMAKAVVGNTPILSFDQKLNNTIKKYM